MRASFSAGIRYLSTINDALKLRIVELTAASYAECGSAMTTETRVNLSLICVRRKYRVCFWSGGVKVIPTSFWALSSWMAGLLAL